MIRKLVYFWAQQPILLLKIKRPYGKYTLEFLSVFIAVLSAFALNNWNDNRRNSLAEKKILLEISNGLKKDVSDISENELGHEWGIRACEFWWRVIENQPVNMDSVRIHHHILTRDFINLQNVSGYETLKSRGLELVKDDSLRSAIITVYEYKYPLLKKLEEDYEEMQFYRSYFHGFNSLIAPYLIFDPKRQVVGIRTPVDLSDDEKNLVKSYLSKIRFNRNYLITQYAKTREEIEKLEEAIAREIDRRG